MSILQHLTLQERLAMGYVSRLWREASLGSITAVCLSDDPFTPDAPWDCTVRVPAVTASQLQFVCARLPRLEVLDLRAPIEPQAALAAALAHCTALHTLKVTEDAARDPGIFQALCALPRPHMLQRLDLEILACTALATPVYQATAGELVFKGLLAQGGSLQFIRLFGNQPLTMPTPDQLRTLCPRITRINVERNRVAGSSTGWLFGPFPGLLGGMLCDMGWQCTGVQCSDMTPDDWHALGSPKLQTLQHLDVEEGLSYTSDDDPDPSDLVDVAAVFRHNTGITFASLKCYNHQVVSLCPFAHSLTRVFWFDLKFSETTWEVMGRELVALEHMQSERCEDLGDTQIAAWGRGMASGSHPRPLRIVDFLFSAASPLAMAQHVLPYCPAIECFLVSGSWTDAALRAWACSALRDIGVPDCSSQQVTAAGLKALLSGPVAATLQSLAIEDNRYTYRHVDAQEEYLVLDDEVVRLLADNCRRLKFLTIGCVTGVSTEGWAALTAFNGALQYLSIGSDTVPHDLPSLLVRDFPLPPDPDTPNKRQARAAQKKAAKKAAKAAAKAKRAALRQLPADPRNCGRQFAESHWDQVGTDSKLSAILPAMNRLLRTENPEPWAQMEGWRRTEKQVWRKARKEVWRGAVERVKELVRDGSASRRRALALHHTLMRALINRGSVCCCVLVSLIVGLVCVGCMGCSAVYLCDLRCRDCRSPRSHAM